MKKVIRLTERDLTRIVRLVIKEEMGSGCEGKEIGKYIVPCGQATYDDWLEDDDPNKVEDKNAINIANQIAKACDCFSNSSFSDWDEIAFVSAIEKIKDKNTFNNVNTIIYCYMKGNGSRVNPFSSIERKMHGKADLESLANKMMDSWESGLKSRAVRVFSKFK